MIKWLKSSKKGVVCSGTKLVKDLEVAWEIRKTKGGGSHQLFLGESTTVMYTRPTVNDCKVLAEGFL